MSDVSTWLWSKLTGQDLAAAQAAGDQADAQLAAMNAQDYAPGGRLYNQIAADQGTQAANKNWQTVQNDLASSQTGDVTGQVDTAFNDQLASETKAIGSLGSGFINDTLKNLFNVIPWQVWVIGGIALFVWLGGLELLKGSLKRRAT